MSNTVPKAGEHSRAESSKKPEKFYEIAVNGELEEVQDDHLTFEEVVSIAYPVSPGPDTVYTVTFRGAKGRHHEGELAAGESVTVKKKGAAFDVTPTGKS
ncbi:multiubiquitin domain-containing protein [Arthrobacter ruber]|uniref:multiubiquitin domain-containing protein n=1 Tax=Arthrobacter ruber TaxID=1258893 RepID=UPI0012FFE281|nr:multiubiquitin domain-containing protein [Arthrobacter ruber]